jgi:protein-S-isoprenylcysteine O-methyltransferase Ste14
MATDRGTSASFAAKVGQAARNVHVADLVVLALVGACVMDTSATLLNAPNPLVQLVLVIACTSAAAKRLLTWRHGECHPISVKGPSQTIAVVAAAAPWLLLPLLRHPLQSWLQWAPLALPLPVRVIGACLMVSGVFGPFWLAPRTSSARARVN